VNATSTGTFLAGLSSSPLGHLRQYKKAQNLAKANKTREMDYVKGFLNLSHRRGAASVGC
jgi:hypothetical protein